MLLVWIKVLVGALLMLSFSIPLLAIARDHHLREEPMPLLVFNLALTDFFFGTVCFSVGALDVVFSEDAPLPLCVSLQYLEFGSVLAVKAATLFLAVDQFIAVVHSLHYYIIMEVQLRRMFLVTWCWIPIVALYGLVCHQLGLEDSLEFDQHVLGAQGSIKECSWSKTAFEVIMFCEVFQLLMASCSAALFVYTATKGMQQERRDKMHGLVDQTCYFFLRFKSFKRIIKVLLTVLALDIICGGVRISIYWWPQLVLSQLVHLLCTLFFLVEAWTYGFSYPAVRSAIRGLFRCRSGQVVVLESPVVRHPTENVEWPERVLERVSRF